MNSYVVLLKLTMPESSYTNLETYLKTADSWAKPMSNVWIIKTSVDASTLRDGVKSRIYNIDQTIILSLDKYWATSNVSREITDWMKITL